MIASRFFTTTFAPVLALAELALARQARPGPQSSGSPAATFREKRRASALRKLFGLLLLAGGAMAFAMRAPAETPQDMLAAQIRLQGFPCDKPLGATKDTQLSKPDHEVWVLKCSDATYRVSRFPDMAAKVERIR